MAAALEAAVEVVVAVVEIVVDTTVIAIIERTPGAIEMTTGKSDEIIDERIDLISPRNVMSVKDVDRSGIKFVTVLVQTGMFCVSRKV